MVDLLQPGSIDTGTHEIAKINTESIGFKQYNNLNKMDYYLKEVEMFSGILTEIQFSYLQYLRYKSKIYHQGG
ncbi:hypothetical protein RCL_jg2755.t1 [Rhizophagus clarus]|uniref:Uncharacterized protein n=1 Tax=Rhizophagus clarus TaxID=94130 RepID=A0A8H3M308_9GLOM|nr:hypothetical protein RCL_jg2755.t1 [Rhizophagus clarus]